MPLTDIEKLSILNKGGFSKATLFENEDMIVSSSYEEVEYIMLPSAAVDSIDDSEQGRAYRITKYFKNSGNDIIAKTVSISDTIPAWADDTSGYQEFTSTADPSSSLAQAYTFKITVDGTAANSGDDLSITTGASNTFAEIAALLETAINDDLGYEAVVVAKVGTKIRVTSTSKGSGSTISIEAPDAGDSLLTLLTDVAAAVDGEDIISAII